MDYKNGKIYKVLNSITDDVYVGSTTQPLSKRMAKHRIDMKTYKKDRLLYTKMNELSADKFYIELIEQCPCDNKEQLRAREGHFIRQLGTLNALIAGRSKKEWTVENSEHVKRHQHEYYQNNKDKIYKKKRMGRSTPRKSQGNEGEMVSRT